MIQRKQSLFLLVAMLLIIFVLFVPLVETQNLIFDSFNIKSTNNQSLNIETYPIAIYVSITALLHLITIFLFKKRPRQMRFTVFCILLALGFYGILSFYHFQTAKILGYGFEDYSYALISPLIAVIFDFLAYKGIQKDEILVRAADRLR